VGTEVVIAKYGTGDVTIEAGAGVTINESGANPLTEQYSLATIKKIAANEWLLVGPAEAASGGGLEYFYAENLNSATATQLGTSESTRVALTLEPGVYHITLFADMTGAGTSSPVITTYFKQGAEYLEITTNSYSRLASFTKITEILSETTFYVNVSASGASSSIRIYGCNISAIKLA
jgi:hypothetical protein